MAPFTALSFVALLAVSYAAASPVILKPAMSERKVASASRAERPRAATRGAAPRADNSAPARFQRQTSSNKVARTVSRPSPSAVTPRTNSSGQTPSGSHAPSVGLHQPMGTSSFNRWIDNFHANGSGSGGGFSLGGLLGHGHTPQASASHWNTPQPHGGPVSSGASHHNGHAGLSVQGHNWGGDAAHPHSNPIAPPSPFSGAQPQNQHPPGGAAAGQIPQLLGHHSSTGSNVHSTGPPLQGQLVGHGLPTIHSGNSLGALPSLPSLPSGISLPSLHTSDLANLHSGPAGHQSNAPPQHGSNSAHGMQWNSHSGLPSFSLNAPGSGSHDAPGVSNYQGLISGPSGDSHRAQQGSAGSPSQSNSLHIPGMPSLPGSFEHGHPANSGLSGYQLVSGQQIHSQMASGSSAPSTHHSTGSSEYPTSNLTPPSSPPYPSSSSDFVTGNPRSRTTNSAGRSSSPSAGAQGEQRGQKRPRVN